jgi:hypothetical protein
MRHILLRFTPRFDRRWLVALGVVALIAAAATFVRWGSSIPDLDLLVLGPDGQFRDTLAIPVDWGDTSTVTADGVVRFPLVFGVRNSGYDHVRPERLVLSVPARYRLTDAGGEPLDARPDPASPLVTYTLEPRLEPVPPGAVPALLPAYETLWIEAVIPRYYCVDLGDSIPDFVPAPPPPVQAMSEVRVFYALEGGDLPTRATGTVTLKIDPALLQVTMPEQPAWFPLVVDPALARPDLGPLRLVASRDVRCGEPEAPMELVSTVWEGQDGSRLITLEYGGTVRKHLYDVDGDGVIERESWDPDGRGQLTATRSASLPIPEFLLPPAQGVSYDMARFFELPADSLARLNPLRRAMSGPGAVPLDRPGAQPVAPGLGAGLGVGLDPTRPGGTAAAAASEPADTAPTPPAPRRRQPLGRPVPDG